MYWYNSRFYDPTLGRFIQPDTIIPQPGNPQSLNRYSYVTNDPLLYTDPSGHFGLLGMAIGGAAGFLYGYGSQVLHNLSTNKEMSLRDALTTDIDRTKIAQATLAGAVIGTGVGLAADVAGMALASVETAQALTTGAAGTVSLWGSSALQRGKDIEAALLQRMSGISLAKNFPTIDRLTDNGIATSIKSIDLGAKTYQNMNTLSATIKDYATKLSSFTGARWGGVEIRSSMIQGRELLLAIPAGASAAQLQLLTQLQQWAAQLSNPVTISVVSVP